jgi:osmotically-inducible protein OsmY
VLTDSEIVDRIMQAASSDVRLDQAALRADVDSAGGVVTLDGSVGRLADKRRLEALAAEVPGVVRIDNRLQVSPDAERSDSEIESSVVRALMEDRAVDETMIRVSVRDGIVTLRGIVPSVAKKKFVGVLAWWAQGVREVDNQLDLRAPEEDNDSEITEAIRAAMDKDHLVDSAGINVHTHHGMVTLRGAVFGEEQREAAENDAWYVQGVRDVDNRLRVSPAPPPPPQRVTLIP